MMTDYQDMTDAEVRQLLENEMPRTLPKGHQSILSPTFKYVNAANTDLARTFARIRSELIHKPANQFEAAYQRMKITDAVINRAMRKDDDD